MNLLSFFSSSKAKGGVVSVEDEKMLASLLVLAWVVEARDPYTGGHLWRVSRLAKLLAEAAGFSEETVARIAIGGFLHDLGKVGIPDAILGKKEKLTDAEYDVIKTHPEIGQRMLAEHPFSDLALDAVLLHHETPDGRGYPFGKRGDEIPVVARIVGVCDAFDAMTSSRPYRAGMPIAKALSIIKENLGRQFDERFGALLIELGDSDALTHIVGHSDEGIPLQQCGMCGPIIVRPKGTKLGDSLYCPACHSEYTVALPAGVLVPTGKQGDARALKAQPDTQLIDKLTKEALPALANY